MGGADIIPGVSGGTMALIMGIYDRLIGALSRFDTTALGMVRRRRWADAARHVDLRFLLTLGLGIGLGILTLGPLMNQLLTPGPNRAPTLAAFFGMILASAVVVFRMVVPRDARHGALSVLLGIGGAAFAFWMTGLETTDAEPTLGYVFFCGMIGICAMILPGISGAYLLLILGLYIHMTDMIKALLHGQVTGNDALTVAVFGAGCAIGLLAFSKVLRWLLEHYHTETLSILCGFMVGALRKIWPFQTDLTPDVAELKHKKFDNFMPESIDGEVVTCIAVGTIALVAVFVLESLGRRLKRHESDSTTGGGV